MATVVAPAPGEFEAHSALMLCCIDWVFEFPTLLFKTLSALYGRIPVVAVVNNESQRQTVLAMLSDWGLPTDWIQFLNLPVTSMWIRDYGPAFVKTGNGVTLLDMAYFPRSHFNEDAVPSQLAELFDLSVRQVPIEMEGGNILSNGRGLAISTASILTANAHRGYDQPKIAEMLQSHFGFSKWLHLVPLMKESTSHIDLFATFTSPDTIVIGKYDKNIDPVNAWILDRNVDLLSSVTFDSRPLNIVRIPMPSNRDGVFRTYTNVVYANGTLLVPVYTDIDPNPREIFDLYASLLPGWDIVGIDATDLIRSRGSLRCVSMGIPWLEEVFEFPRPHREKQNLKSLQVSI